MIRLLLTCLFCWISFGDYAQKVEKEISFNIHFGDEQLKLNKWYEGEKDTFKFETIKFFVSNIEFVNEDSVVHIIPESFYLIDLEDSSSKKLSLFLPSSLAYTKIRFNIGIDSITNTAGVGNGVLDPTNGMYWTWQSGYINVKLEGISKKCTARKKFFQFHLGGYLPPFLSVQSISFLDSINLNTTLYLDFKTIMDQLDLSKKSNIMSPKKEAVDLSKIIANSIKSENE